MINLLKDIYYCLWYSFECEDNKALWWYNRHSREICNVRDMNSDQTNEDVGSSEWLQNRDWIPFPQIDIVSLEKCFLKSIQKEKVVDELSAMSVGDFDSRFERYIDYHYLVPAWHEYEGKHLREALINWCNSNHIVAKGG